MRRIRALRHDPADRPVGDPHAEEPWCSCRPGSFPYREEPAALR